MKLEQVKVGVGGGDRRGGVGRRKSDSDPKAQRDRRWFYPPRIENRGKSLPFTRKEKDFVPTKNTVRRRDDKIYPVAARERGER